MATIDAETLFPNDRTVEAVRDGKMSQIHRWYEAEATGLDPVEEADTR